MKKDIKTEIQGNSEKLSVFSFRVFCFFVTTELLSGAEGLRKVYKTQELIFSQRVYKNVSNFFSTKTTLYHKKKKYIRAHKWLFLIW